VIDLFDGHAVLLERITQCVHSHQMTIQNSFLQTDDIGTSLRTDEKRKTTRKEIQNYALVDWLNPCSRL
jgi:hypothetical protein